MNTILWILQILLGLFFLMHGVAAIVKPANMRGQLDKLPYSSGFLSFIGICEILGSIGLILPMWTAIAPWLTPLAAIGLTIIMLGAVRTHLLAKETAQIIGTTVFVLALSFVIYGRWILFS